jgi:phage terminase large subunit
MKQKVNRKYKDLFTLSKRYQLLMGGRGAGRSTVESQYILAKLIAPEYFRCAVMRFVLGDIRNSCFREIKDRAEEQGILQALNINESQMTISYGANVIQAHGFRKSSGDQSAKLKSLANYNHVWIEEADEVPEEDFMQLDDSLRTVKGSISLHLTFNPPSRSHWLIKRFFDLEPSEEKDFYIPILKPNEDVHYIRTDYKDNIKNIDEGTQRRYEEYKNTKPSHYWNMIKGYVPEILQGKIYKGWKMIEAVPHEARLLGVGLDFGFDPDPAAAVEIYDYNGGILLNEILYQTQLLNSHLATFLLARPSAPIVADCAEPKSIEELRQAGLMVIPSTKGADSVRFGIKEIQAKKISVTRSSTNIWKEYDNYVWKITKDGDETGIEDPKCANHLMSALRYGINDLKVEKEPEPDPIFDQWGTYYRD